MSKFKGKNIAILGLGINGVDAANYLLLNECKITIFDHKSKTELADWISMLNSKAITLVLGRKTFNKLDGFDLIFRSPGVNPNLPELKNAIKSGVSVSSPISEFFEECKATIIGVTGTKGKGTTSTLINNIIRDSGKNVYLAGNIGMPILSLLPKLSENDYVVLELSSFQLIDIKRSPHISVITNITQDHLDYHSSVEEYEDSKKNITKFQKGSDYLVLNIDDQKSKNLAGETSAKIYYFSIQTKTNGCYLAGENFVDPLTNKSIIKTSDLKIIGQHNWQNVAAAITVGLICNISPAKIAKSVKEFSGLEHRLELVRDLNGVKFYNDSFGTTPETAIAAINSFKEPLILIAGGSPKGSNYEELGKAIIKSSVKKVFLIGRTAPEINESIKKAGHFKGEVITDIQNFKYVIETANKSAKPGYVVLLSPACASFDMFKNYKERGKIFKQLVSELE